MLAVGVDKYARKDWKPSYAAKDASSFAAALKPGEGPLRRPPSAPLPLSSSGLASIVKARDVFVLFLGGHDRPIAGSGWFYLPQDLDLAHEAFIRLGPALKEISSRRQDCRAFSETVKS